MSKIIIPDVKGRDLYDFLVQNKTGLINQKKMITKECDSVKSDYNFLVVNKGGELIEKKSIAGSNNEPIEGYENYVDVKVIANTANWFDSHMDVLLRDAPKKSIRERKGLIPHLHDHIHRLDEMVGDVQNIYLADMMLTDLGINKVGSTQVLIFETRIRKDYNEKIFNLYREKKVKQHSIGLQYMGMELAIKDTKYEKENDFWNKYINVVINREEAEEAGYMWIIPEYKLIENSAVLFGSNRITHTLETEDGEEKTEQPGIVGTKEIDLPPPSIVEYIKQTKFINL